MPLGRLFVVCRLQRAKLLPSDRSAVSRMFPLLHLFIVASCIFFSCCRPQDLVPACALLCCVSRYPLTPSAGVGRWPARGMIVQWFAEQVSSLSVALPGVCFCSYFGFWPGKLISAVCLAGQVNPLKLCCVLRSFSHVYCCILLASCTMTLGGANFTLSVDFWVKAVSFSTRCWH